MTDELVKAAVLYNRSYRTLHTFVTSILSQYDLTPLKWAFLLTILRRPNSTLKEYATVLGIDPPFITQLTDEMSAFKMITMAHHTEDKRKKVITLTPHGKSLAMKSLADLQKNLEVFFSGADPKDVEAHLRILNYIISKG